MAAALSPQQLAAIEAQLSSNPAILQALADEQRKLGGRMAAGGNNPDPRFQQSRANVLRRYGIEFPDAGDYQILVDPSGQVRLQRQNWFQRNADWIVPVATIGTGGILNATGVIGGAAGSAPTAASTTGPAGVGAAPIAAPATGGTLPATVLGNGATGTVAGGTGISGTAAGGSAAGGILGTLKKYSGAAGDMGTLLTGAAGGAAEGRRKDAAENRYRAEYNRDLPAVRTNQVTRGEVLNTMQDAKPTGDPRIDKFGGGGLRPSAFGPMSRQAGGELARGALSNLMNPDQDRLKPSQAGMGENIAAGAGLGLSIFDLLRKYGSTPTMRYGGQ